jgi:site-specific DNA-methyltransferase (adenine-specific)
MLPLNKIILGDALFELKKLPDESCDVIIVDPPYNIGKDFGNNIDKRELSEYISWCKNWINECIRVMKPSGTMFIYGFSEILAYISVEIPINKRWLIWHYTNKNVASLNFWQRSHEAIICAWKNKPIFNRDAVREPYTEGFLKGAAGKVRKGTIGRFSKNGIETVYKAHEGGALPRDVIKVPALAGGAGIKERWFLCKTCDGVFKSQELKNHIKHEIIKHPTQKPIELSKRLILSAMPKEQGVVLVPFAGSGTVGLEALLTERNAILIDINYLLQVIAPIKFYRDKTALDKNILLKKIQDLKTNKELFIPDYNNIRYWYPDNFFETISRYWYKVHQLEEDIYKWIIQAALVRVSKLFSWAEDKTPKLFKSKFKKNSLRHYLIKIGNEN